MTSIGSSEFPPPSPHLALQEEQESLALGSEQATNAEAILQAELAALSLEDHERILFDVHGIGNVDDLNDDEFHEKLRLMEVELDKITEKPAYDLVKSRCPGYVYDKKFRRMFLRSQEFDPAEAARVMVTHFETKRMVYGDGEILCRDVRQSDLQEVDMEFLRTGALQVIPSRDAAGRMIFCMADLKKASKHTNEVAMMRPLFYIGMRVCQDEDAQRNGCVWIKYQTDGNYETEFALFDEMKENICKIIPCRAVGGHFCSHDETAKKFVAEFQLNRNEFERFRIRHHIGTQQEVNFELQTYGIPTEDCPMGEDGVTWSSDWHREWLRLLKEQEDEEQARGNAVIVIPRRFDVLLGKTRRSLDHTGNRRLAHICEMNYKEYCNAIKHKKTEMADRVVSSIHEAGGRFLQWSEKTGWVVAPDLVARNKVAHTFRFLRAKKQKEAAAKEQDKRKEDSTVSTEPVNETDNTSASEGSGGEEFSTEKRTATAPPSDILMYNPVAVDEDRRNRRRKA